MATAAYRKDIDGLRAIAVLSVILCHYDLGLNGGFVGVDVFFVISGYLISRIIFQGIDSGNFSFSRFWERRLRRLFPALFLTICLVMVFGAKVIPPKEFRELGYVVASQPMLCANIALWRTANVSYFAEGPELRPLLHTWSLAVEEQFYIALPLLAFLLARRRKRVIVAVLAFLFLTSLVASSLITPLKPEASYYLLPFRAYELLLGCLGGVIPFPTLSKACRELLGAIGSLCILYSAMNFNKETTFPGLMALVPCMGTLLLLKAGENGQHHSMGRMLSLRPVVYIGLISYPLYLFHWPLLSLWLNALFVLNLRAKLFLFFLSATLAAAVYHFLEKPVRLSRSPAFSRSFLWFVAFASTFQIAVGTLMVASEGLPERWSRKALDYLEVFNDRRRLKTLTISDIRKREFFRFDSGRPGSTRPRLFVWGDSHAIGVIEGLREAIGDQNFTLEGAVGFSTPPCFITKVKSGDFRGTGEQALWTKLVLEYLMDRPPTAVVLVARWDNYYPEDYREGLANTLQALRRQGQEVWFAIPVPTYEHSVPRIIALRVNSGQSETGYSIDPEAYNVQTAAIRLELDHAGFPLARRIELSNNMIQQGRFFPVLNGVCLYCDDNHLSSKGSAFLAPTLRNLVKACQERFLIHGNQPSLPSCSYNLKAKKSSE